jgi:hypothetical protein
LCGLFLFWAGLVLPRRRYRENSESRNILNMLYIIVDKKRNQKGNGPNKENKDTIRQHIERHTGGVSENAFLGMASIVLKSRMTE